MHKSANDKGSARYQWTLVALLSLNYGIVFFDRNALNFLMPFIQPEMQLSGTQIGILASAMSLTWSLAAFTLGRLSDKMGSRKGLLIVSTLIFSLCSIVAGLAGSFAMLLAARLLMGLSEGGVMPISQTMIARAVPARHRGLAMGITQNFGSSLLGTFVAPLLLIAIGLHYGWRHAFMFAALPGLISAFLIWRFVREDPVPTDEAKQPSAPLRTVFAERNVILCAMVAIMFVGYFLISMAFLPIYLVQQRGLSPTTMGWLIAVLGVASTVNSFVLPGLADRFGRKPIMIIGSILGVLVPISALTYHGALTPLVVMLALGWSPIALFPIFMAAIPSESVAPHVSATAIGLVMALGESVGGVLSPALAGMANDAFGPDTAMWILIGLSVVATGLTLGLRETMPARSSAAHGLALPD